MGIAGMNATAAALLEALRTAETQGDTVPDGWLTIPQLAEALGCGESSVRRRLALVRHETKQFRVKVASGRLLPVVYYRLG